MFKILQLCWLLCLCGMENTIQAKTIRVVDNLDQPRPHVRVLIGTAEDDPFSENSTETNLNGDFVVPPKWKSPLPVTLEGEDLVRTTYFQVSPDISTLKISLADGNQKIELKGTLTNYNTVKRDGKIDVGALIPAVSRKQLLNFDIGSLISSETDTITVFNNKLAIPSNITLPNQQESYSFFPITLNKPDFRTYVRRPGNYQFLAVHGQFPFAKVVDQLRGGEPAYNIINDINLLKCGTAEYQIQSNIQNQSISVADIEFNSGFNVQAPSLDNDDVLFTMALSQISQKKDILIPSDIKRLTSHETRTMRIPSGAINPMAVSLLFKDIRQNTDSVQDIDQQNSLHPNPTSQIAPLPFDLFYRPWSLQSSSNKQINFNQLSLAIHPSDGQAPSLLSLIPPPSVLGKNGLSLQPPERQTYIQPLGTLVIYSAIKFIRSSPESNGSEQAPQMEQRTRLWELWVPGWVDHLDLPNIPSVPLSLKPDMFRWEVLYLGSSNKSSLRADITNADIDHTDTINFIEINKASNMINPQDITHVSRHALTFQ